MELIVDG